MIYRRMPALLRVLPDAVQRHVLHFEGLIEGAAREFAAALPRGARVLDAGAGEAQYAALFDGHRYVAVDLGVGDAAWIGVSTPFHFGTPAFKVAAVVPMLIVALVVFGPSKLPQIGRQVGRGFREFRKFQAGLRDDIEDAFREEDLDHWLPLLRANPDIAFEVAVTSEEGLDHRQRDDWLRAKAETENVRRRAEEDVAKAKELLAKAGLPNGFDVTMETTNKTEARELSASLQSTMAQAGINLIIKLADNKTTLTRYRASEHDIYLGEWGSDYQDPHSNAEGYLIAPLSATSSPSLPSSRLMSVFCT